MNELEREALQILNDPRLSTGQKANRVAQITGTPTGPHGPGLSDIMRCTRGSVRGSKNYHKTFYGFDRP